MDFEDVLLLVDGGAAGLGEFEALRGLLGPNVSKSDQYLPDSPVSLGPMGRTI